MLSGVILLKRQGSEFFCFQENPFPECVWYAEKQTGSKKRCIPFTNER